VPDPCHLPVVKVACSAANTISAAVDFAKDPLGYIAQKMQAAAAGLASTVLPQLERLTHPDLSAGWFLDAYRVSFALAIFIFVAFLGWNFLQLARRRVSGDDVVETLGFYTPLFFGGVILGPALGSLLLELTGALTDTLIQWGIAGSVTGTTTALQAAIAAGDPAKITGGAIVAIVFFFCLIVALVLCFVVLLVMLVTLYLTGAIIPLSLVWLVHPRQRAKGLKVVMVWVGICFSHVLLFLLLGVAFRMVGGLSTNFDQPGLKILANLAVAVIALLAATLSPLGLLAFAPVGPSSAAGSGPAFSVPGQRRSGGGFPQSDGDSQTAQLARGAASQVGETGEPAAAGAAEASAAGGVAAGGGLAGLLSPRGQGVQSSALMEPDGSGEQAGSSGGTAGVEPAPAAGGAGPSEAAGSQPAGTGGSRPRNAAENASSAGWATAGNPAEDSTAGPGGGAQAGVQAGEQAGDRLSSAGTAAAATGVGAPVGAALAAAGQGVKAAGSVLGATAELARSAGDMAAEHMEHAEAPDLGPQQNRGGGGADTRPGR